MISDGENWHYLVVKTLSGLLTGITSNHKEDFYCLNCFHSYKTKNKLEAHKKSLFDNEPMLKSQQKFKSENHEVYTENINKIALSSNDDKRIVALDGITSYPYGYCGED